jgi:hypothetical protein
VQRLRYALPYQEKEETNLFLLSQLLSRWAGFRSKPKQLEFYGVAYAFLELRYSNIKVALEGQGFRPNQGKRTLKEGE